jgi:AraC-like DNA-binding protein
MRRSVQLSNQDARLSVKTCSRFVVATYLPRKLQLRLEAFLAPRHTIVPATSWASAAAIIRQQHVDLLLVDPTVDGETDADVIARLIAEFPSVAVVVYTTMTPATVSTVHKLTKRGLHQAIIYEFDDTPERLALLLDGLPSRRFLPAVSDALQPAISKLPLLVQQRVHEALETPTLFRSVTQLARSANVSRQNLYLLFQQAGLGSPGRLLIAARLIQAYAYLCDPVVSLRGTAAKVGWDDPRTLKQYLGRAFGMSVDHLRQHGSTDDLVKCLVKWMRADNE